jgi:hypothetical protein
LKLKGNLGQAYDQIQAKLSTLRKARNSLLDPAYTVDLDTAFHEAEQEILKKVKDLKLAGRSESVQKAFYSIYDDVQKARGYDLMVSVPEAENAKEAMGFLGAWTYGRQDPDSMAMELAANTIYPKIRQAIEKALPQGTQVADLNAQMQKLIPVQNAILARTPVEYRNRIFSLADITAAIPAMVTGRGGELALILASRLQKEHRFGAWLTRNAESATGATSALGKLIGGMMNVGYEPSPGAETGQANVLLRAIANELDRQPDRQKWHRPGQIEEETIP